jgi:hypothetical protein
MALITLLIFLSTSVFAQRYNAYEYHALINHAEIQITKRCFGKALAIYEDAMGGFEQAFGKDLYNTALCAQYSGNLKKANHYVQDLIILGFEIEDFEELDVWKPLIQSKYWKKTVKKKNNLHRLHFDLVNLDFLSEIRMLEDYAYQFRREQSSSSSYEDTIRQIDERNIQRLSELMDIYGFPSEHAIGVRGLSYPPYFVVLLYEYRSHQTKLPNIHGKLEEALQKGDLSPHMYAYLLDQNEWSKGFGTDLLNPELGLLSRHFMSANKDDINAKRMEIGLGTISDEREKMAFTSSGLGFYFDRLEEPDMSNYKGYKEFNVHTYEGQDQPVKLSVPWQ